MTETGGEQRVIETNGPFDLRRTLDRYSLTGYDPSRRVVESRVWYAFDTPAGPAKIAYRVLEPERVEARAWGPGAGHALDAAPRHLGVHDDPRAFEPKHELMRDLHRRFVGLRVGGTGRVLERLVPTIIGQKVTGKGASRSIRELIWKHGAIAPGPEPELRIVPAAEVLARLRYFDFHPFGIERRRAEVIRDVARRGRSLEALASAPAETLRARLLAFHGIGPWTTEIVVGGTLGDPDAVPTGDYHLPNLVAFALAGEPRADDARMLELLEPYRGQRARALAYLSNSGISAPRWGPRLSVRDIRGQ